MRERETNQRDIRNHFRSIVHAALWCLPTLAAPNLMQLSGGAYLLLPLQLQPRAFSVQLQPQGQGLLVLSGEPQGQGLQFGGPGRWFGKGSVVGAPRAGAPVWEHQGQGLQFGGPGRWFGKGSVVGAPRAGAPVWEPQGQGLQFGGQGSSRWFGPGKWRHGKGKGKKPICFQPPCFQPPLDALVKRVCTDTPPGKWLGHGKGKGKELTPTPPTEPPPERLLKKSLSRKRSRERGQTPSSSPSRCSPRRSSSPSSSSTPPSRSPPRSPSLSPRRRRKSPKKHRHVMSDKIRGKLYSCWTVSPERKPRSLPPAGMTAEEFNQL